MTATWDQDELGVWDLPLKMAGDAERRTFVELAPDQECRYLDAPQQIALIGLGHEAQLRFQGLAPNVAGDGLEQRHELSRRLSGEQPGKGRVELPGRRREHLARPHHPGPDLILGQRPLPAGVRVGEDQARNEFGTVAIELLCDGAPPRETANVGGTECEVFDHSRETARVIRQVEIRRQVRRPPRSGLVPGHDGKVIDQVSELRLPDAPIRRGAMRQDERLSVADPLVGDLEPVDRNELHRSNLPKVARRVSPDASIGIEGVPKPPASMIRRLATLATLVILTLLAVAVLLTAASGYVHRTNDNGTIGRAKLDGSGIDQAFITGATRPVGIAVDQGHIYWANADANSIGRANLDGSGVNQSFVTGAISPVGVDAWGLFGP